MSNCFPTGLCYHIFIWRGTRTRLNGNSERTSNSIKCPYGRRFPAAGCRVLQFFINDVQPLQRMQGELFSVHPEMVDCGSGQGRSDVATAGVAEATPGIAKSENAGLCRKTPLMDGH
jgi:hypothetical protein